MNINIKNFLLSKSTCFRKTRSTRDVLRDTSGAVALIVALAIPVLGGFGMLGLDAGTWYFERRSLQTAADAGAIAGAWKLAYATSAVSSSDLTEIAQTDATANGFVSSEGTITVTSPPSSGPGAGDSRAVSVQISHPAKLILANIIKGSAFNVTTRATATTIIGHQYCILGLNDQTSGISVDMSGSGTLNMDCGIMSNSPNPSGSTEIGGNATANVTEIAMVGNINTIGSGYSFGADTQILEGMRPVEDPYDGIALPAHSADCSTNGGPKAGGTTADGTPIYVWCDGFNPAASTTTNLATGIHIVDGGDFRVNSNVTVNGTGVTIMLTNGATINNINGGGILNLSAPTSGSTQGVLFYGDRNEAMDDNVINGGPSINLNGALYFPSQSLTVSGNVAGSSGCLQMVAWEVALTGNSTITLPNDNCDAINAGNLGRPELVLLE